MTYIGTQVDDYYLEIISKSFKKYALHKARSLFCLWVFIVGDNLYLKFSQANSDLLDKESSRLMSGSTLF